MIVSAHRRLAALAALAVALAATPALGQPRDNPLERARHHMELGQDAFARGEFAAAGQSFLDAYAASPFPAFLYNAGLAAEKGGESAKAIELYRRYLREEPAAADAAEIDVKIRTLLVEAPTPTVEGEVAPGVPAPPPAAPAEMKSLITVRTNPSEARIRILDGAGAEVAAFDGTSATTVKGGRYTIEASHPDYRTVQTDLAVEPGQVAIVVVEMSQGAFLGFLHVRSDAPGAAVYVDDKAKGAVGTTPWGNVLPPGRHRIWVEKPGYVPAEQEVEVAVGDKKELDVVLERLPYGVLVVKANIPGAKVYLDERSLGPAPIEEQAPPGNHTLRVAAEGMKDYTTVVEIGRGATTKALVRLNPEPSRTPAWVSLGFAVALYAGGAVAGGIALHLHNELEAERERGRLADDDPRIVRGFGLSIGADVGFGLGLVLTGMCAYYFARDSLPPSEGKVLDPEEMGAADPPVAARPGPTLAVVPLIAADRAGLVVAVGF
jgi:tetratricopeptide (TPR) repeat protein